MLCFVFSRFFSRYFPFFFSFFLYWRCWVQVAQFPELSNRTKATITRGLIQVEHYIHHTTRSLNATFVSRIRDLLRAVYFQDVPALAFSFKTKSLSSAIRLPFLRIPPWPAWFNVERRMHPLQSGTSARLERSFHAVQNGPRTTLHLSWNPRSIAQNLCVFKKRETMLIRKKKRKEGNFLSSVA